MIFVFGSNLAGRHGAGAALVALRRHGAVLGQGRGLFGNSYALPTVDEALRPLSLAEVAEEVGHFIDVADARPDLTFQVTRVGCGIAGFKDSEIAPLFRGSPQNCQFDEKWEAWLPFWKFWGAYP